MKKAILVAISGLMFLGVLSQASANRAATSTMWEVKN